MKDELRTELAATQEAVEQFCRDFQKWLGEDITSRDAFGAELLLREALVNAILHGCQSKTDQRVKCIVRGGRGRILIVVVDPGRGFDWRAAWNCRSEPTQCSGRGVEIYRNYAKRVRFSRQGNVVYLVVKMHKGMGMEMEKKGTS